jgi:hypothetical protein
VANKQCVKTISYGQILVTWWPIWLHLRQPERSSHRSRTMRVLSWGGRRRHHEIKKKLVFKKPQNTDHSPAFYEKKKSQNSNNPSAIMIGMSVSGAHIASHRQTTDLCAKIHGAPRWMLFLCPIVTNESCFSERHTDRSRYAQILHNARGTKVNFAIEKKEWNRSM